MTVKNKFSCLDDPAPLPGIPMADAVAGAEKLATGGVSGAAMPQPAATDKPAQTLEEVEALAAKMAAGRFPYPLSEEAAEALAAEFEHMRTEAGQKDRLNRIAEETKRAAGARLPPQRPDWCEPPPGEMGARWLELEAEIFSAAEVLERELTASAYAALSAFAQRIAELAERPEASGRAGRSSGASPIVPGSPGGAWRVNPAAPSRVRRFIVWLVLGWTWQK